MSCIFSISATLSAAFTRYGAAKDIYSTRINSIITAGAVPLISAKRTPESISFGSHEITLALAVSKFSVQNFIADSLVKEKPSWKRCSLFQNFIIRFII